MIAPSHTGSALTRWKRTAEQPDFREMPLARVSAISGAAVSSNMGNKTTQTLSIVLTLFNVRLGRWVRNPRLFQRSSIKRPPSLYLYFKELFAQASRDDEVVYLSDGGTSRTSVSTSCFGGVAVLSWRCPPA